MIWLDEALARADAMNLAAGRCLVCGGAGVVANLTTSAGVNGGPTLKAEA